MEWDDLRVFLAAHRAKSLAGAARDLRLDRTTVGRKLAALETALGAELFTRTRDGLRPTDAADRLAPRAERMAAEVQGALEDDSGGDRDVRGTVRLATTEGLGIFLVQRGLCDLRARHPALVIELLGGNRPTDLAAGEADLALRVASTREAGVKVRRVASLPIGVCASRAYLDARGAPRSVATLAGHDLLLPGGELARLPEAKVLEAAPGARVVFRSSSLPALVTAATRGHGLTPITMAWAEAELGLERLFTLDVPPRALWLAFRPGAEKRAAVRVVARRIEAILTPA